MRLGIVCPYSLQAPGGVQFHIRDLAQRLVADGIDVRVLAPADEGTPLPDFVDPAGASLAIPYNGSVARLTFGPIARARVRRWLDRGRFDLVHLHEPQVPSLSMLALQAAQVPVVATFHTSMIRSRALTAVQPVLRPLMERISARIAVSEDARRTLVEHLGGDAVVIPNGVECCEFAQAPADSRFRGSASAPTVGFLGRLDEPRKGLAVLAAAWPAVLAAHPGARLLVAGSGDVAQAAARFDAPGVEFLGPVSEADKRALLRSVDVYVAPQTGGESFGIVLVEGMAAGTTVLASDLGAFTRVIDDGTSGVLFPTGDAAGGGVGGSAERSGPPGGPGPAGPGVRPPLRLVRGVPAGAQRVRPGGAGGGAARTGRRPAHGGPARDRAVARGGTASRRSPDPLR